MMRQGREWFGFRCYVARLWARRRRERAWMWAAWHLPRPLVLWCGIRVVAHATTGGYGDTVVPELGAMDAIGRWDDPRGGDPSHGRENGGRA